MGVNPYLISAVIISIALAYGYHEWEQVTVDASPKASLATFHFAQQLMLFGLFSVCDTILDVACEISDVPMGNWYAQLAQKHVVAAALPTVALSAASSLRGGAADFPPAFAAIGLVFAVVLGGIYAQRRGLIVTFSVDPDDIADGLSDDEPNTFGSDRGHPLAPPSGPRSMSISRPPKLSFRACAAVALVAFALVAGSIATDGLLQHSSGQFTARGCVGAVLSWIALPVAAFYTQAAQFEARTSPDLISMTADDYTPGHLKWVRALAAVKWLLSFLRQLSAWVCIFAAPLIAIENIPAIAGGDTSFLVAWHHVGDRLPEAVGAALALGLAQLMMASFVQTNVARALACHVSGLGGSYLIHSFMASPHHRTFGLKPSPWLAAFAAVCALVGLTAAAAGYCWYLDPKRYRDETPRPAVLVRSQSKYELFEEEPMEQRQRLSFSSRFNESDTSHA
jgi:hypothetical protein